MARNKKLGSVASRLMEDDEIRRDAYSAGKTILKVVGYTAAAGILFLVGRKIYRSIRANIKQRKELKTYEKELKENKTKQSYSDSWYSQKSATLKKAMQTDKGYKDDYLSWSNISYDKDKIKSVLNALKNEFDWKALIISFDSVEGHNLKEWLGLDDEGDVKAYNTILSNIGVKEVDQIDNIQLNWKWSLGATPPIPIS